MKFPRVDYLVGFIVLANLTYLNISVFSLNRQDKASTIPSHINNETATLDSYIDAGIPTFEDSLPAENDIFIEFDQNSIKSLPLDSNNIMRPPKSTLKPVAKYENNPALIEYIDADSRAILSFVSKEPVNIGEFIDVQLP